MTGTLFLAEIRRCGRGGETRYRSYPGVPTFHRWVAAALGQWGRTAEAKEAMEKATAIAPAQIDMFVQGRVSWTRPEDHAHMLDGLRKAGWQD